MIDPDRVTQLAYLPGDRVRTELGFNWDGNPGSHLALSYVCRFPLLVFADALAGMAAGWAGGFACVVVDRAEQTEALREQGASIVVSDLSELLEDR